MAQDVVRVIGFTRGLANDLGAHSITVNYAVDGGLAKYQRHPLRTAGE
ncbi:hypothetical protein ACVLD2_000347 [Paenibacillus sp. PvR052]